MRRGLRWAGLWAGLLLTLPAVAQTSLRGATLLAAAPAADKATGATRSGREIYARFREGLADPHCDAGSGSPRWREHFASAPGRLAARNDDLLPLFGYVVDALREASLPTEYALIPFVESGYKPGARSASGPAGLWQMIALTARNHHVPMRPGYDGRLSPIDSTQAAVRYLKTLHGMFAGDWRLAVMAYNAGEYRILGALKRSGQKARSARPEQLPGLSEMNHAYVRKLRALSCLMEQANDREEWMRALDRPVPTLVAVRVPDDITDLASWAARNGQDAAQLRRLNPVFADGRFPAGGRSSVPAVAAASAAMGAVLAPGDRLLANAAAEPAPAAQQITASRSDRSDPGAATSTAAAPAGAPARTHTVAPGENASTIARRYGIPVAELLQRNQLGTRSLLKPGNVLRVDPPLTDASAVRE